MSQATFLDRIIVAVRARLAERQARVPLDALREQAGRQPPALDFAAELRPTDGGVRAIAEFKRASPSKGVIRAGAAPDAMAEAYLAGGAAAISVLTEEDFFQGCLDDLRAVKRVVGNKAAVLRKDFIVDPYQVVEARAAGADSFLLIVALLADAQLARLLATGRGLGMEPLVEVHDADETDRAVRSGARIIGVNARDLRTFAVDTTLLRYIRPRIPADRVVVAESGVATMSDVARLRGYGAQAILVGETLMRADHPATALQELIKLPAALHLTRPRAGTIVKLCGMQTLEDALAAYAAGADLIGLVFVPGKRRRVAIEQGRAIVQALPNDALTVGLFLIDETNRTDEIMEVIAATGVKAAQLHSRTLHPSSPRLTVPVIRATNRHRVPVCTTEANKYTEIVAPSLQVSIELGVLPIFDSAPAEELGGSGKTGDWARAAAEARHFPFILAGGLMPDNVGAAIRQIQPWGVDVSSGIEGPDGRKDPARMRAFVQAVRAADGLREHDINEAEHENTKKHEGHED